jgi:hypothetical protein
MAYRTHLDSISLSLNLYPAVSNIKGRALKSFASTMCRPRGIGDEGASKSTHPANLVHRR